MTTFVEWDAAIVDRESWRERLQAYEKYLSRNDCATRYAGAHMMIQIYVPNETLRKKRVWTWRACYNRRSDCAAC
jgi:hypothetical protein